MTDPREELGYVGAPPAAAVEACPAPALPLPELLTDQLRTLRKVAAGRPLNRNIWTLLSMSELAHMDLIAPNNERLEKWVLTPRGVEVLEKAKR